MAEGGPSEAFPRVSAVGHTALEGDTGRATTRTLSEPGFLLHRKINWAKEADGQSKTGGSLSPGALEPGASCPLLTRPSNKLLFFHLQGLQCMLPLFSP